MFKEEMTIIKCIKHVTPHGVEGVFYLIGQKLETEWYSCSGYYTSSFIRHIISMILIMWISKHCLGWVRCTEVKGEAAEGPASMVVLRCPCTIMSICSTSLCWAVYGSSHEHFCTTEKIPAIANYGNYYTFWSLFSAFNYPHSVEGVFYRIGQKLEWYKLEPVAHTIDDHNYFQL